MDFFTHAFDLSHTVQIMLGATFIPIVHEDYTINRRGRGALGTIEGEIPSSATSMAVMETKIAVPEDPQACFV